LLIPVTNHNDGIIEILHIKSSVIGILRKKKKINIYSAGDGRFESRGFSAYYCVYFILGINL